MTLSGKDLIFTCKKGLNPADIFTSKVYMLCVLATPLSEYLPWSETYDNFKVLTKEFEVFLNYSYVSLCEFKFLRDNALAVTDSITLNGKPIEYFSSKEDIETILWGTGE